MAHWPEIADVNTDDVFRTHSRHYAGQAMVIEGDLVDEPTHAYEKLKSRLAGTGTTALLRSNPDGKPVLLLAPSNLFSRGVQVNRWWLNVLLLLATVITTTWAGAAHQGVNLLQQPERFTVGLPYAGALLLILGAHELGHYFAARIHGIVVSLPYFIPVPFALGTFGAFISMRSVAEQRRALFDVSVAGPLAGLVFAIPALWIGLQYSTVTGGNGTANLSMMHQGVNVGSSLLLTGIAKLAIPGLISQGHRLVLHPLAFAGWLGLLVTALNLLPIGQLDGGHMADAMFGPRISRIIGTIAMVLLIALGFFVWSGLLFWALIIYFIAGSKGMPPLNDLSPLPAGRRVLGALTFIVLLLILTPVPQTLYQAAGLHSPYL